MPVVRKVQLVQQIPVNFVVVKNTSDLQIHVPFGGDTYVFNPGEELEVVESAFYFWTGDIKKEDKDKIKEEERLVNRWKKEKLGCRIDSEGKIVDRVTAFPIPLILVGKVESKNMLMVGGQLMIPATAGEATALKKAQEENAALKKRLSEYEKDLEKLTDPGDEETETKAKPVKSIFEKD